MIAGKDQHIVRIIRFHIFQILINSVGRSCIPVASLASLIRRKDGNPSNIAVQIPRNTNSDVGVQTQRLILSKNSHRVNSRINTVAEREVNNPVLSAKGNRRLCHFLCQNAQAAALPTC